MIRATVLLVDEAVVQWENHRIAASFWQISSHNAVQHTLRHEISDLVMSNNESYRCKLMPLSIRKSKYTPAIILHHVLFLFPKRLVHYIFQCKLCVFIYLVRTPFSKLKNMMLTCIWPVSLHITEHIQLYMWTTKKIVGYLP